MPILNWIGKDKVINHHLDVPFHTLNEEYNFGSTSENKIINADNLLALKSLLPQYEGRIKCIYIDPPYNTGNEGWVYNDNVNDPKFKKWLKSVVGKEGEDLTRHDKWLCMMYPRLKLLHKLLADDGAIFISIDDNEQANLKLIMDEIFGIKNSVANLVWDLGTGTQAGHFVRAHEYITVYFKNKDLIPNFKGGEGLIEHSALKKISIKNPASEFNFPAGTRFDAPEGFELKGTWGGSEKTTLLKGSMIATNGKLKEPVILSAGWAQKNQMLAWFNGENTIDSKGQSVKSFYFNKSGILRYEKERSVINPPTVLKELGSTKNGSILLEHIFEKNVFDFPKSIDLVTFLIDLATDKNSIILDSFAGSGTTAHAVLNLNKQDGGNRKFILVEMEDYAESITAERVKRVINGYNDKEGTDGGFTYYTMGQRVLDDEDNLNPHLALHKIHQYIWYAETRTPFLANATAAGYLGKHNYTGIYFNYKPNEVTVLDDAYLVNITEPCEQYIVYADMCLLPEKLMEKHNIIFKKIPRDISKL